ncbi:MAG: DUF4149 domain-containing protein [Pseudomonadota bacterium]
MTAAGWTARLGDGAERVLVTAWVGSLWAVGYVVAPQLFATLDDRTLAGGIAGGLFETQTWISITCGALLLLLYGVSRRKRQYGDLRLWLVIVMLALMAASEWLLGPLMADAERGSRAFALLHGASALLYLAASVAGLGLVLVARPGTRGP